MSEPDSPRWLKEVTDELRRDVIVRSTWRTRLLEEVARARKPSAHDTVDERFDDEGELGHQPERHHRAITLGPLAGLAAATVLVALGAGVTYMAMSARGGGSADRQRSVAAAPPQLVSGAPASSEREVVRFELSAPRASRVALVGSFNEWNPVATPLSRDPASGKWVVSLRLPPGRHVYAFVVDGDVTADPAAPRAADDDFGSTNSVVLVTAPRT